VTSRGITRFGSDRESARIPTWLVLLAQWRYGVLGVWAGVWSFFGERPPGDWSFFVRATDVLLGRIAGHAPLSVYADFPNIQIGPASLVSALPLRFLGGAEGSAVVAVIMAVAPAALFLAERSASVLSVHRPEAPVAVLVAGVLVIPMWHEVAVFGHLDDALVLLALAWAMYSVSRGHPVITGVALALAMSAKPWAAGAVVIIAALPSARARAQALATSLGLLALAWSPFLLGDPRTAGSLSSFRLDVTASSTLALLGVDEGPMPAWVRPTQVLIAAVLGWIAVRKGRWAAVPIVVVASRLALEPANFSYYYGGLVLAAALLDVGMRRRVPWWTGAVLLVQFDIRAVMSSNGTQVGVLNLCLFLAVAVMSVAPRVRRGPRPRAAPADRSPARSR
jgi:hypothetical protein